MTNWFQKKLYNFNFFRQFQNSGMADATKAEFIVRTVILQCKFLPLLKINSSKRNFQAISISDVIIMVLMILLVLMLDSPFWILKKKANKSQITGSPAVHCSILTMTELLNLILLYSFQINQFCDIFSSLSSFYIVGRKLFSYKRGNSEKKKKNEVLKKKSGVHSRHANAPLK